MLSADFEEGCVGVLWRDILIYFAILILLYLIVTILILILILILYYLIELIIICYLFLFSVLQFYFCGRFTNQSLFVFLFRVIVSAIPHYCFCFVDAFSFPISCLCFLLCVSCFCGRLSCWPYLCGRISVLFLLFCFAINRMWQMSYKRHDVRHCLVYLVKRKLRAWKSILLLLFARCNYV